MRNLSALAAAALLMGSTMGRQGDTLFREIIEVPSFDFVGRHHRTRMTSSPSRRPRSRSKYMPHIGAKERRRYIGWPDGPMHVTGHERRAEHAKWLASLEAPSAMAA